MKDTIKDAIKERKQFPFYRSFMDALDKATKSQRLELYDGIIHFAFLGSEPKFEDKICEIFWALIKPNLDASISHYIAGRKGGCPEGVKKPSMANNKNASKIKTKSKPNQNQIKRNIEEEKEEEIERYIYKNASLSQNQIAQLNKQVFCTIKFKDLAYPMTPEQWNKIRNEWDFGTKKFSEVMRDIIPECDSYLVSGTGAKKSGAYEILIDKLTHLGYKLRRV